MFTQAFLNELEIPFAKQAGRMGGYGEKLSALMAECDVHKAEALKCLYASMPLSDALDYPPALFEAFAEHGVFLWERGPFAGRVPERLFAGYVLSHRVNDEDLTDHRRFFYEKLREEIRGLNMREAVLAVNYWCAAHVTYRATDARTAGPVCVYRSAYGRCGEESVFTVSVLRSLGIPARQVYVPLWSHCDDNHAWVEAWCDGEWVFLGACEPEERVNKGWFTRAASRAMLVHSRWFLPVEPPEEWGIASEGTDMSRSLNHLGRYARAVWLEVAVYERTGMPAVDARVCFEVMNRACFGRIASMRTDREGICRLFVGRGSLSVTAWKDGFYGECLVDVEEKQRCKILLAPPGALPIRMEVWEKMVIRAPEESAVNRCTQTEEEIRRGRRKGAEAAERRRKRENGFYDSEEAERAVCGLEEQERERCRRILRDARGNRREIEAFLMDFGEGKYPASWRIALPGSLREKDWRDVTADVLKDACLLAADRATCHEKSVFIPFVLCPRVGNEMLRPHRGYLRSWLEREDVRERVGRLAGGQTAVTYKNGEPSSDKYDDAAGEAIRQNPFLAWKLVRECIRSDSRREYGTLTASPRAALEGGYGSELTRRTVCVQLLRTLGIPARLSPEEGIPEVWEGPSGAPAEEGRFVRLTEEKEQTGRILFTGQEGEDWIYYGNWTLARFGEKGWETLSLGKEEGEKISRTVLLSPGKYRILTANRLPDGDILAGRLLFDLEPGEEREVRLKLFPAALSDMRMSCRLTDISFRGEDKTPASLSGLTEKRGGLFIWVGEDEEPTWHILNEIRQRSEDYARLPTKLYFVAARPEVRENPMFAKVSEDLKASWLFPQDFDADMETLARSMYLEPGRLPLVVIVDSAMTGVYGVAGYNVGTGDMVLKLLEYMKEEN